MTSRVRVCLPGALLVSMWLVGPVVAERDAVQPSELRPSTGSGRRELVERRSVGPSGLSASSQDLPPALDALLKRIKGADTGQLAVSEEDGRFLRVVVAAGRAKRALEIGSASGYSAIWIGLGLRQTGGHLTTIEYDQKRARQAGENVRTAGLSDIVRVVHGDAFQEVPKLSGTFDFVFLDAWKRDYKRFFDVVYPRLDRGGLFLAHNVVNKRSEMGDFLAAILDGPNLLTAIVTPSGEGISISYKK